MPGGFPLLGDLANGNDANAAFSQLSVPGSTNSKGSWTNLGSTTANDATALFVIFSYGNISGARCSVDVGIGTTVIAADIFMSSVAIGTIAFEFGRILIPVNIPSGSQIAARYQTSNTAQGMFLKAAVFDGGFTNSSGGPLIDSVGFTAGTTASTLLTPGASNGKGSFANLTASSANDYAGFWVCTDPGSLTTSTDTGTILVDIAIGSGNTIVVPNYPFLIGGTNASAVFHEAIISPFFPIRIPAGTQISARCSASYSSTDTPGVTLAALRA